MIFRRRTLSVLTALTALAWTSCLPAAPMSAENQEGRPLAPQKTPPTVAHSIKADDNLSRVRLLMADAVQKDLGLTADQLGKILDSVKVSREQSREFVAKWPDFFVSIIPVETSVETTEARAREFQVSLRDLQRKQKELRAKVVGMLTPRQSERLKQIQLQQRIAIALTEPELIKALDVSETQLVRIRPLSNRIGENLLAESNDLFRLSSKERRNKLVELSSKRDKAQAEANKLAIDVLTPEQRAKLETLLGSNVEVTWEYDELVSSDDAMF